MRSIKVFFIVLTFKNSKANFKLTTPMRLVVYFCLIGFLLEERKDEERKGWAEMKTDEASLFVEHEQKTFLVGVAIFLLYKLAYEMPPLPND